jgi:hypothetical protein
LAKCVRSLVVSLCVTTLIGVAAQSQTGVPTTSTLERPFVKESILAERDFPLLSSMLDDTATRTLLAQDAMLKTLTAERWEAVASANRTCGADLTCKSKSLRFTPAQIAAVSDELHRLYKETPSMKSFAHMKLQPASIYSLDPSLTDGSRMINAWERSAQSLNRIISTYCDGTAPHYGEIDSMTYQADSKTYAGLVTILLDDLAIEENAATALRPQDETLFFEPTLRFAIRLLQSNSRDEAGRYWPLQTGENAAAIKQIPSTPWERYPYSVIVIPGAGSEVQNIAISPWGRERVRLGVAAFRSGKAPLIMVSGGFVHPSQTPFCEAIEMKRYLMEIYAIPESAILVDPYARHTTTNLRNASREVFTYGLQSNKPMLIVSDDAQVTYIQSDTFLKRNQEELGYLPVTLGRRISPSELEATPSLKSLYRDASDPLDP